MRTIRELFPRFANALYTAAIIAGATIAITSGAVILYLADRNTPSFLPWITAATGVLIAYGAWEESRETTKTVRPAEDHFVGRAQNEQAS